ncbi:hypothetical protein ACFYXM_33495 [Streptomyces sp. NPDC002476]|uniref:hypothetical protein n=1 Tax=Streptomyces sp. NPDC002476 TaxID=3364648 RepID=UPI003674BA28
MTDPRGSDSGGRARATSPCASARDLLDDGPSLIHVFDADTWELAMAQYHAYMGWGPYRPA